MKTLNFNVMLIFRLLFKGTKVPENREGILFPDLKVGAIQPVWLAAPAAGQAIKPFNYSTSLAGASLTGQFGWLKRSGNPDLSGTGHSTIQLFN